jgi:hypothetical protein
MKPRYRCIHDEVNNEDYFVEIWGQFAYEIDPEDYEQEEEEDE